MSFYTVGLRDEIGGLPGGDLIVTELDRIAAFSKTIQASMDAFGLTLTSQAATAGLDTGKLIQTLPSDTPPIPIGTIMQMLFGMGIVPAPPVVPPPVFVFPPETFGWWAFRVRGTVTADVVAQGIGTANPAVAGAATSNNVATNIYVLFQASAGLWAGLAGSGATAQTPITLAEHDPTFVINLQTGGAGQLTAVRIWATLDGTAPPNADTANHNTMGFRYSDAVDGGWVGICCDNAGGQSVTPMIAPIAIGTHYQLKLRKKLGTVFFSVNGSAEQSLSANLPNATTELGYTVRIYDTSFVNTKDLLISSGSCRYGSY